LPGWVSVVVDVAGGVVDVAGVEASAAELTKAGVEALSPPQAARASSDDSVAARANLARR